ncbi:Long chronological lifespan protein 2 [Exophiala xenobiotica]|uniref:Long chronological lifespan protein 2 n=1 Tax=Lithohypha guttulata TaxID=1690604 RepID=A0ABR0K7U9_9EURO|nr:Long chronological lifespan protein 2 [Lithohypha guttulata]KAK5316647.1 Long chronological lifespan protein 2 [Exophiala xenobiotica]
MFFLWFLTLFVAAASASAQFQFFDQFFGGQQQQGGQQEKQNVASDSTWFQQNWQQACVHFPHHCPCAFPEVEDKVELGEGVRLCATKGGFKEGETLRKIELARKGLI